MAFIKMFHYLQKANNFICPIHVYVILLFDQNLVDYLPKILPCGVGNADSPVMEGCN